MNKQLDDLLERRYNNIETLELDQVTLGVSKWMLLSESLEFLILRVFFFQT